MSKEIKEYDKNNNLIHSKSSDGFEEWKEYDENNNKIHYKNSTGFEYRYKYDKNNNLVYWKNSNGYEVWKEYDENNNLIHKKNTDGYEYWQEYDEKSRLIHYKNSFGEETWDKYDENNKKIPITEQEYVLSQISKGQKKIQNTKVEDFIETITKVLEENKDKILLDYECDNIITEVAPDNPKQAWRKWINTGLKKLSITWIEKELSKGENKMINSEELDNLDCIENVDEKITDILEKVESIEEKIDDTVQKIDWVIKVIQNNLEGENDYI